jgi:hypothetical protein
VLLICLQQGKQAAIRYGSGMTWSQVLAEAVLRDYVVVSGATMVSKLSCMIDHISLPVKTSPSEQVAVGSKVVAMAP